METKKKKVGLFLRVSSEQQASYDKNNASAKKDEADIPTQRSICMRKIAEQPDWEFYKDYVEVGSGHKYKFKDRPKLQEAVADAENGVIDILFCFMYDRIGRRAFDTPLIVKRIIDAGVEVWSYSEGKYKLETDADEFVSFVYSWLSDSEVKKLSKRVTESMAEMAMSGEYIGGKPPFGYKRIEVGGFTKKGLPKRSFAINEDEAEIVRLIFHLAVTRHYGHHRIAKHLNENGLLTRKGKQWSNASIGNVLRNPIYKGYKAYNRTTQKNADNRQVRKPREQWILPETPNPAWVIVPEEVWEEVQVIKDAVVARQKEQQEYNESIPDHVLGRSPLLFVGYIYCGCCGFKMQTGYSPYRWRTEDGELHRRDNPVYKCGRRASGKLGCTGKSSYKSHLIEGVVLEEIDGYMTQLEQMDLAAEVERIRKANTASEAVKVKNLTAELKKLETAVTKLKEEVVKTLIGESAFNQNTLNELVLEKEAAKLEVEAQLEMARQELRDKELEQSDLLELQSMVPKWREEFAAADLDVKKVMLSKIINKITVSPDDIKVDLTLTFRQFFSGDDVTTNGINPRPHRR